MKVIKHTSNVLIEKQEQNLSRMTRNGQRRHILVCIDFDYINPIGQVEIRKTNEGYFGDITFDELQDREIIGLLYPAIAYMHNKDGSCGIFALGLCTRENQDPEIKPLSHYLQ